MVFKKAEKKQVAKTVSGSRTVTESIAKKVVKRPLSKKNSESFKVFIHRVLKQVHPETGISKRSMSIMNSFINDLFEKISIESSKLVRFTKKHTLSSREV